MNIQACVPENWTDNQVVAFVEKHHPCGTEYGWQPHKALARVECAERAGFSHVVVSA